MARGKPVLTGWMTSRCAVGMDSQSEILASLSASIDGRLGRVPANGAQIARVWR